MRKCQNSVLDHKTKLENGTQIMIDHQNGIKNLDKMIRKEIQILKAYFP